MIKEQGYLFIKKSLFFPEYGILVIGDLHLGYEHSLRQSGVLIPERQIKEAIEDLREIFEEIKKRDLKLKKIIFIGDIKHSFGYKYEEKNYFRKVMEFLKDYIDEKNIIFIKGNHDTIDFSFGKMKKFWVWKNIGFIHGHQSYDIFSKKVKTIVLGHLHPSVILKDKQNVKREKYKCFLVGKYKNKNIIVLPSFLNTIEGTTINDYKKEYEDYFSVIPKRTLMNFEVYVIGEDKTYEFGKVKKLR